MLHLPLNLIRYLVICQVNSSVVWLPRSLSVELSLVLGTIIANRLPTLQASLWRKALALWNEYGGISLIRKKSLRNVPDASWPMEPVSRLQPGRWIGKQKFTTIPAPVVPCLELASIFHVGGYTHFGCGTFVID